MTADMFKSTLGLDWNSATSIAVAMDTTSDLKQAECGKKSHLQCTVENKPLAQKARNKVGAVQKLQLLKVRFHLVRV